VAGEKLPAGGGKSSWNVDNSHSHDPKDQVQNKAAIAARWQKHG